MTPLPHAQAHNEELVEALGKRELRFMVATEDFGLVWRGNNWKLPTFALCTGGVGWACRPAGWLAVAGSV
jgi:hypothetical protein